MTFALNNSAALAWCLEHEQTPAVMPLLDRVRPSAEGLLVGPQVAPPRFADLIVLREAAYFLATQPSAIATAH